jgi:type I restriction enzyme S subunit
MGEVDDKLEQEQQNKKHLKELKRGLMQDLLTGKVRVNTDN